MKTIYKYPIEVTDEQEIKIPDNSKILCVQTQNDMPCLWAVVDTNERYKSSIKLLTFGTGHPVSNEQDYIGTYQTKGLVFHVFTAKN